ncbi:MAG TPA: twin-arginine translocation signal domain-containing protein [Candidatus Angelobacter sp.]|nr:twin-arginine translocation signal domain-containing protein [Candidatus Angelobacter sp.]
MSLEPRSRRDFLRLTAAGLAVPALAPDPMFAQKR